MLQTGRHFFTSESVTEGHPDKIADQISDAVLDAVLRDDPTGRVACETLVTTGLAFVAGEITTKTYVDLPDDRARRRSRRSATRDAKFGFDYETCAVINAIDPQSADIAMGVDTGRRRRPGPDVRLRLRRDRGADAAADHAGAPARAAAHRSAAQGRARLPAARRQVPGHRRVRRQPPARIDTVVISTQHAEAIKHAALKEAIIEEVIKPVIPARLLDETTPSSTSTRPAASSSADRTATPA